MENVTFEKPLGLGPNGLAIYAPDSALLVEFYEQEELNNFKTALSGKPEYDNKEFVRIETPGAKSNYVGEVTDEHKKRFAYQYQNFKAGLTGKVNGTPLRDFPGMTAAEKAMYVARGVLTIEQLAAFNDQQCGEFGIGSEGHRSRAQSYLKRASDIAAEEKANAKIADLEKKIAALSALVASAEEPETKEPEKKAKKAKKTEPEELQLGSISFEPEEQ